MKCKIAFRKLRQVQNLNKGKINSRIPEDIKKSLKAIDREPLLERYTVAHPGNSETYIVGYGNVNIEWDNDCIKKLYEMSSLPIAAFKGHGETNGHEGRVSIGSAVNSSIDNDNNMEVIVYRYPGTKNENYDVASFEGDFDINLSKIRENETYKMTPQKITRITGIALADSNDLSPAFPNAVKKESLQFGKNNKGGTEVMDKKELLDALLELGYKPGGSTVDSKNSDSELKKMKDRHAAKEAELMGKIKEIEDRHVKEIFPYKLGEHIKNREGLTEQQREFIKKMDFPGLDSKNTDIDSAIKAHVDGSLNKFAEMANIFTTETGEKNKNADSDSVINAAGKQNNENVPNLWGENNANTIGNIGDQGEKGTAESGLI